MKKVILNQKSYLLYDEMINFKKSFDKLKYNDFEFILFPPIMYLSLYKNSKYYVGTQNFFSYNLGSFTGEINLESLKNIGINYTLIGHSERRKIIFESIDITKEKLFKSLSSKCNTILCVGEERKTRRPFNFIKKQLNYYLRSIDSSTLKYLSILYEPSWAIGSGEVQCIDKINIVIDEIKKYMKKKYNINISVYYGGSINEENAKAVFDICDGIVIGKASCNINNLMSLLKDFK